MGIRLEDLPQAMQDKITGKKPKRTNKYNAQKTTVAMPNGSMYTFDSKHEAERFGELHLMERAGAIHNLQLQRSFTLQESYITSNGATVGKITYKADFTYWKNGQMIVEDAKSPATRKDKQYILKKKLMADRYGIHIVEV